MSILGLHHITLVCSNAQRTVDFYTRVLGLRFIKKTVNFDVPTSYHLYFGDETGRPGTAVTFFEWPDSPKGTPGIGGTHHFALQVADDEGLLKWKRRLVDLGLKVDGPLDRHYFKSIYFRDPDGVILEIATVGLSRDDAWRLKTLFELIRDSRLDDPAVPRLEVRVESLDSLRSTAWVARPAGTLAAAPRALRIELPWAARTTYRETYTRILGTFLSESATFLVARER